MLYFMPDAQLFLQPQQLEDTVVSFNLYLNQSRSEVTGNHGNQEVIQLLIQYLT